MLAAPQDKNPAKDLPPFVYQGHLSYTEQWKQLQTKRLPQQTLLDLDFVHNGSGVPVYLVGCTRLGQVCIWRMPSPTTGLEHHSDDDEDDVDVASRRADCDDSLKPFYRFQVVQPTGTLYSIQISPREDDQGHWLVVAGTGGVWLYHWQEDIEPLLLQSPQKTTLPRPRAHFSLHPSATESDLEVNDTTLHHGCLYGAAGDAFGCYKWDLTRQELITTYQQPGGYLLAVQRVPHTNLLLMGGDAGILGIYDMEKDVAVDQLSMTNALTTSSNSSGTTMSAQQTHRCISSIVARDENWWTIAGGSLDNVSGGYLSTFHGPTRSVVASVETCESPQQLALYNNNDNVLSVANEHWVSHWSDALSLQQPPRRVWCDAPSAYAVKVALDGRIAVAGVGGTVNLYEQATQLTATLRL